MTDSFFDLKFFYDSANTEGYFDLRLGDDDFVIDETIVTAGLVSEFSDRRVDDVVSDYHGGWWATEIMGIDPKKWGSKRWTLYNKRLDKNTLRLWEQYTVGAYQWMIDEGILVSVTCEAIISGINELSYTVWITNPDDTVSKTTNVVVWES